MWRPEVARLVAGMTAATLAPRLAMAGIPFRQDESTSPLQLGLGYAGALALLALMALGLFLLNKRLRLGLQQGLPEFMSGRSGLQCVASLRMAMRTQVHVVSWRGREVMFAQCGERLHVLAKFEADRAPEDAPS